MPRFRFEAMGSTGEAEADHLQSANADEAMQVLRKRGLFVVALKEVPESSEVAGTPDSSLPAADSESFGKKIEAPKNRWIGAIVSAVGLACAAVGIGGGADAVWFRLGSERASALVVDIPRGIRVCDLLEFTATGRQYRVDARGIFGIRWGNSAGLGVRVDVLYPPGHPQNARLADYTSQFVGPIIFLFLGLMFTPCGILILRHGIRLRSGR